MNKKQFREITAKLISEIVSELTEENISANIVVAITLTIELFEQRLIEYLFDSDDEITIER